jgi:hypothetical protein
MEDSDDDFTGKDEDSDSDTTIGEENWYNEDGIDDFQGPKYLEHDEDKESDNSYSSLWYIEGNV